MTSADTFDLKKEDTGIEKQDEDLEMKLKNSTLENPLTSNKTLETNEDIAKAEVYKEQGNEAFKCK